MTFVYGSYQTVIDSFRPNGITCPNCRSESQIVVDKTARVIHIMFIPIIPISITTLFTCKSCNYEFTINGLDPEAKTYFKTFKSKKRVPIWFYSGPLFVLIATGFYGYSKIQNENEMYKRLLNGNQKQIIEYRMDDGQYSSMRTLKITDDSVWLNYNSFQISEYKFIDRITGDEFYDIETIPVSLKSLEEMIKKGRVQAVYSQ